MPVTREADGRDGFSGREALAISAMFCGHLAERIEKMAASKLTFGVLTTTEQHVLLDALERHRIAVTAQCKLLCDEDDRLTIRAGNLWVPEKAEPDSARAAQATGRTDDAK